MSHSQKKSWLDFFNRERKRLVDYVRSRIQDSGAFGGEDIVQDVIAGIWEKTDISAPIENFSAYVYQALRNRVVDYMRQRRKHESIDVELPGDTGLVLSDILTDMKYTTAGEVERREINRDLCKAIDTLDEKYRSIFVATEMQGLTFQELSDEWNVPVGTLLARKSRAMKMIRELLIEIDSDYYACLQKKGCLP